MEKIRDRFRTLYRTYIRPKPPFPGSAEYWERRYQKGGTSGAGSYSALARFKAEVLNAFVCDHDVQSVIEFGCGDGNQVQLSKYPKYTGYDVSQAALSLCEAAFSFDRSKEFAHAESYDGRKADLSLSLDVVYHLIEDEVFDRYMTDLFRAATKFVAVYSSNFDQLPTLRSPHIRHRKFTDWVESHEADWRLHSYQQNAFPFNGDDDRTTFADFYFFERSVPALV